MLVFDISAIVAGLGPNDPKCTFPDPRTQIWQSVSNGPFVAQFSPTESSVEKVPKFPGTRALAYEVRTLSEPSVTHLVVFLKYFDRISMAPFRPVWDVYYYTAPATADCVGTEKGPRRNTLRDSRIPARGPWRNLRGEAGAVVVVSGATSNR